jgi:HAD superfamily hydrolase (TIGR01509 family)
MKVILIDTIETFVISTEGGFKIFKPLYELLEKFPNRKILLTSANDQQFKDFGLSEMPYEVFTLKHNPEKSDPKYYQTMLQHFDLNLEDVIYIEQNLNSINSAESVGIKTYYWDKINKPLQSLELFLKKNL